MFDHRNIEKINAVLSEIEQEAEGTVDLKRFNDELDKKLEEMGYGEVLLFLRRNWEVPENTDIKIIFLMSTVTGIPFKEITSNIFSLKLSDFPVLVKINETRFRTSAEEYINNTGIRFIEEKDGNYVFKIEDKEKVTELLKKEAL